MVDKERLVKKAHSYGINIEHCADALCLYARLLVDYNKKVNLTAITDSEGIENKHFIDSLLFAACEQVSSRVVDVGTGAGFPGIVAKLYNPKIKLTLMEPTGKRVEFLRYACAELGLEAELVKERAEEAARKQWRESFDIATARAVAGLDMLCEYCLPLVRVGGQFIALKGAAEEEIETAQGAVARLGGEIIQSKGFILPSGERRTLVFIKKISHTPTAYPRNGGKIAKSPLK